MRWLIVAARHNVAVLDCRVLRGPSRALLFSFQRGAAPVAVDVHFEDRGVVHEAVHCGERHSGIWKDLRPFAKGLVGCDESGAPFVWQFMRDNWLSNRIFKSYDDILDHCCFAWNRLTDQPWRIMSIGLRTWAHRF